MFTRLRRWFRRPVATASEIDALSAAIVLLRSSGILAGERLEALMALRRRLQ